MTGEKTASIPDNMNFPVLVDAIQQVHKQCAVRASLAVNMSLTIRNWVIGWYIRGYEQNGTDRARYGEGLLDRLSESLINVGFKELTARYLRLCRQFASVYPGIRQALTANSNSLKFLDSIWGSLTAKSSISEQIAIIEPAPSRSGVPPETLLNSLSFTHLVELVAIDDPFKRSFYEIECIRGSWSVRQLKRQIATLYCERSSLSLDKEKFADIVQQEEQATEPRIAIRDPYIFEFLGLKAKDAVEESDLEAALVENLRDFLLELGYGFCLEAQQKSILIGNTRGFVDLVFYHRILKCHVLVELKVDEFRHEHIGQLNTYVTWYRKHMMSAGDNPPVGLLLCTQKDHALIEYALAAINNRLFVSKYQVELPSREELRTFLEQKRKELGDDV